MEVKDILKEAVTISEEASFTQAIGAMIEKQTNTLLVTDTDGLLVGVVSVADLLDAIVPEYLDGDSIAAHFATEDMFKEAVKDTQEKQVQFFMSHDFSTVEMDDGLMAVAATAIAHQRGRIPVVDTDGRPVGIISRQGLKHIIGNFLGIKDSA
ncbi:MAG: putative transcriptional regulator [Candidatus Azotimanducaceae bacterium]|jgi:predicted transcriptional regulator